MRVDEIIPLIAAAVNLALVIFIITQGIRSVLHRVYVVWGCSIVVWNLGTAFMFSVRNAEEALVWARFLHFGVVFLPVTVFHLTLLICQVSMPRLVKAIYAFAFLMAALNCAGLLVTGVHNVGYAYYSVGGPLYFVFVAAYAALTWASMFILFQRGRNAPPSLKSRIKTMQWASGILIAFGNNDILPILGIYHYPFTGIQIFPLGSLAANFYAVLVAYSVLQHELLDIHLTMSKAAARLVRLTFVFVIALVMLLIVWTAAPRALTPISFLIALGVVIVTSTLASVLFPRLFGSGADSIERRILGDRFEYQDRIRAFIDSVQESGDAEQVLSGLDDLLTKVIRVSGYQLLMIEDSTRKFTVLQEYPVREESHPAITGTDSPLLKYFRNTHAEVLAINLPVETRGTATAQLENEARAALATLASTRAEFCFPFIVSTEPFGMLFIDSRAEGKRYTATDIQLLKMLSRNLSLALNQIRLKSQILQAQESELLGRMSRGMAHDMNNLVTPVQTLMQLLAEGISAEDLREELLPLATRSIETLREYIREALFFSENARADFKLGRLDMILAESVQIVAPRCEQKKIRMILAPPPEVPAEVDKSLIKRTLTNILSNAIDASTAGMEIHVALALLEKTETDRDWFRIQIIDQGEGIPAENMQRIFNPYFTTKNRGDEQRGFGLGLSICRKVVQLHGGTLKLASQPRKGTTVTIDLPDHQLKSATQDLQQVA